MQLFSAVILVFLGAVLLHQGECSTVQERTAALEQVMRSRGNIHIRPDGERGDRSPVIVNVSFSLLRIPYVNIQYSRMEMVGYFVMWWKDPRLAFSSGNISSLRIPVDDIWTPDIELYNSDAKVQVLNQKPLAVVSSNGHVTLVYNVAMNAMCDIDIRDRRAQCVMNFGSWTYSGHGIDLGVGSLVDVSDFVENERVSLSEPPTGERVVKYYPCCPEPYVTATFTFKLQKRT